MPHRHELAGSPGQDKTMCSLSPRLQLTWVPQTRFFSPPALGPVLAMISLLQGLFLWGKKPSEQVQYHPDIGEYS